MEVSEITMTAVLGMVDGVSPAEVGVADPGGVVEGVAETVGELVGEEVSAGNVGGMIVSVGVTVGSMGEPSPQPAAMGSSIVTNQPRGRVS